MLFADLATSLTGGGAGCQLPGDQFHRRLGLPQYHATCGVAYIGTIEIYADALQHLHDVGFRQTGIGATDAGFGTLETCFNAFFQQVLIEWGFYRVCLKHLVNLGHLTPL
jgi:hypothetical protein